MKILPGESYPLGATVERGGVNFCIFSKTAERLELLLFDTPEDLAPSHVISLDPRRNRTFFYWHVFVTGIGAGQIYAYRAYGPYEPGVGHRFDGDKVLIDPYARAVVGDERYDRQAAIAPGDNCATAFRSVVVDPNTYDWEGDTHPCIPYAKTIIYELHVGGFTNHPSSGVTPEQRGTFAGLMAKIPYLQSLGITAVELMPIQQFDTQDAQPGHENYWGYSSIAFFAPHRGYSARKDPLGPVDEFRDLVKALHRAGIEVILDVVFNHTAEGNEQGPTLSFRGLENQVYYILDEEDAAKYANYSGCGNTVKANNAIVGRWIIDCLRYWVAEMHVDGFRFDLASVLSRDQFGRPLEDPPILWSIESDPILAGTKIIAEAWDAAGLYQVGSFIGDRFAEWNGPFRDDVRRFVRGEPGMVYRLANRIQGSPDIYTQPDRETTRSVNFITCHDGFTLNDLVSYNEKHNEANGEENRDGANANFSWNCGFEGPTQNPLVENLRQRQIKNLLTILMVSQGTPMLLMGDEVRRSQGGNNNAYCQNNQISWFDWSALKQHQGFLEFVRGLVQFIQSLQIFQQQQILATSVDPDQPYICWHGVSLEQPDWSYHSRSLAFTLGHPHAQELIHVMLNAFWEPLEFALPPLAKGQRWYRIVDTALPPGKDFCPLVQSPPVMGQHYAVGARSAVVLMVR